MTPLKIKSVTTAFTFCSAYYYYVNKIETLSPFFLKRLEPAI